MSDITITDGLPEAWTLANTDKLKLDEANLINLAVGQLALLGASQGLVLREQTGVLKELIGGVDKVNAQLDFLSNVNSTPSSWSGNPSLGIPAEAVGWKVPSSGALTSNDVILVDKMRDAYSNYLNSINDVIKNPDGIFRQDYNGTVGIKYNLNQDGLNKIYVTKEIMYGKANVDNFNLENINLDQPSILYTVDLHDKVENGQIFGVESPGGFFYYAYLSNKFVKLSSDFVKFFFDTFNNEKFYIPQSTTQLQNWNYGADGDPLRAGVSSAKIAWDNTILLGSSSVVLVPNTLPQTDPPTFPAPSNEIKMNIDAGTEYDMARYEFTGDFRPNIPYLYASYPPEKVAKIDSSILTKENVGKVVQAGDGPAFYIYSDSYGYILKSEIGKSSPFIYSPSKDQVINWKGQYAEKIIVITQRSSDQQLFVTNLAQKYQYAFDAATYVLKAFTSALSSAANNI